MQMIRFDSELLQEQVRMLLFLHDNLDGRLTDLINVEKDLSSIKQNKTILASKNAMSVHRTSIGKVLDEINRLSSAVREATDIFNICEAELSQTADHSNDAQNNLNDRLVGPFAESGTQDILIMPDGDWRITLMPLVPEWLSKIISRYDKLAEQIINNK